MTATANIANIPFLILQSAITLRLYVASNAEFVILNFRTDEANLEYFIESYRLFTTETLTRLQAQGKIEDKPFLISYSLHMNSDGNILKEYGGVGDRLTIQDVSTMGFGTTLYKSNYYHSELEEQRLQELYGSVSEVSLQFDITEQNVSRTPPQNVVQSSVISYDSVSNLGPISSESFTISSTSVTDTEDIEFGTEVITDVGGVVSRDRELDNIILGGDVFDAVLESEIESGADFGEAFVNTIERTRTVTTSGY
jgi:hypothetical protein